MSVGDESPQKLWPEILEWRAANADGGISDVQHVGQFDHVGHGVVRATEARRVNVVEGCVGRQKGHRDGEYMALIRKSAGSTQELSLIHISEPTRRTPISYA